MEIQSMYTLGNATLSKMFITLTRCFIAISATEREWNMSVLYETQIAAHYGMQTEESIWAGRVDILQRDVKVLVLDAVFEK